MAPHLYTPPQGFTPQPLGLTDKPQFAGIGIGVAPDASVIGLFSTAHATEPGITITQSSTGDAYLRLALGSTISYAWGIDNSVAGDPLVLSTAASGGATIGASLLTLDSTGNATFAGATTVKNWLNAGTTTLAAAQGDLAVGLTGGSQLWYDQSTSSLFWYDSAGNQSHCFRTHASSGQLGIGQSSPWCSVDILGSSDAQIVGIQIEDNGSGACKFYIGTNYDTAKLLIRDQVAGKIRVSLSASAFVINDDSADLDTRIESDTNANCFNLDGGYSNITVNAAPVSDDYDLGLCGCGVLMLKETTTPTADTNYGKVYTKSDNKLYFQDGDGTEHEIKFV
jgi:hypothetical protein